MRSTWEPVDEPPPPLTSSNSPANPPADRIPALETVPSSLANASLRYSYTPKYATDLDKREIRRKITVKQSS